MNVFVDTSAFLAVLNADDSFHQQAITTFLTANRQHLSLVDCSSFIMMHQNNINHAFTFDRRFSEQGFEVLGLKL